MAIHFQKESLQTYRTSIEVTGRNEIWIVERGVTVLSETGYAVHADGYQYGVTLQNEGTLSAWQDYGVRLDGQSSWVINNAGATISGRGGVKAGARSNVDNFGEIITYSDTRPAIDIDGRSDSGPIRINNSGTIEGANAIRVDGAARVEMANDGTILGAVALGKGDDRVVNHGILDGEVSLGGGKDTFLGSGGGDVRVDGGGGRDVIVGSDGNDYLVGGGGKDKVYGGDGDDILVGCYGKDVLDGGDGSDTFVFLNTKGVDRIRDFDPIEDTIHLDNAVFRKLGAEGVLSAEAFRIGAKAGDADDHVIYDAETGVLKYDKNGDAAGGVVKIAKLAPGLDLGHHDFEII
jgi:Ca2+-binding RTX toxin-like protein